MYVGLEEGLEMVDDFHNFIWNHPIKSRDEVKIELWVTVPTSFLVI